MLRFIAAGRIYRGSGTGTAKSTTWPVFPAKQFLVPSVVTELALRWSLWRQNTTLRTVRVKNGEVITLLISSLLCLGMSDHRYCPGDLIQWEQHQFVVLGVGRHQLWIQKTSENGEVIGFTKELLHTLHVKNAIRLVKKRSTLHRVRSDKVKTKFTPSVLPKTVSNVTAESSPAQPSAEEHEEKDRSPHVIDPASDQDSTSASTAQLEDYSEADFEHPSVLSAALLADVDCWTHSEDSCLVEWLELRSRILGTHPLNMTLDQITSPASVVEQLQEQGYADEVRGGVARLMGMLPDPAASASASSAVTDFMLRFKPLVSKSLISLRLRALVLLHVNDTLSPLLSTVFDPSTVDAISAHRPLKPPSLDLMSPLTTMILAHRHVILLEVKFSLGFRLGWLTMMSHCMLEGGGNNVSTMLQKKAIFMERKHQSFAEGGAPPGSPPSAVVKGDITFSACPTELPILPQRSPPTRGNSAQQDGKSLGDSIAATVCALNSLNNPLHPSNVLVNGSAKTSSGSHKSEAQGGSSATKPTPSGGGPSGEAGHLQRLSVYYFEDSTSCYLNWSTYGLSIPIPATPSSTAISAALPPLSGSSSILGLPVINMFIAEPKRLQRGIVEYSKKTQLQQLFEQDFRWRLLTNFQSSLLGQFMQTMERLEVQQQQLASKLTPGGAAAVGGAADSDAAHATTSFLSPIAPEGPWNRILRSVFRGGMFWEEHMSPSSRPVSVYVHFLPPPANPCSGEGGGNKRERRASE